MSDIDIVKLLEHWQGHDDVPEALHQVLSQAADEIRGLRYDVAVYKKLADDDIPF